MPNIVEAVFVVICYLACAGTVAPQQQPHDAFPEKKTLSTTSTNPSDIVTSTLINVNAQGAPRLMETSNLFRKKRNAARNLANVHLTSKNRRLVNPPINSNPKNDVEVFAPLEGGPPGYAPQPPQPVPQPPQAPAFPPSLPDYPPSIYPNEPPYYYYPNVPYYPSMNPIYPPRQPQVPPVTQRRPFYPEYTSRTRDPEPTTAPTPRLYGHQAPTTETEPEIEIVRTRIRTTAKPRSKTTKTSPPHKPKVTLSPSTLHPRKWTKLTTHKPPIKWSTPKSRTNFQTKFSYVPKVTVKRETPSEKSATPAYPSDPYTNTIPSSHVYSPQHYPATEDPKNIFHPWTTKRPLAPPAIYPLLTQTVVPNYQPFLGQAIAESAVIEIGTRRTNKTTEKLQHARSAGAWVRPTPAVEIIGTPSLLDPKYKLAVVSNYQNFNETTGIFGFDIDLENGLTVQVRGYKKDGKQILDGSYSLFTNNGEPVKITYIADDEKQNETDAQFTSSETDKKSANIVPSEYDENWAVEDETTTEFFDN